MLIDRIPPLTELLEWNTVFPRARGEMADALDSGSSVERHGGSSPLERNFVSESYPLPLEILFA